MSMDRADVDAVALDVTRIKLLQSILERLQESSGVGAVDQPMIVAEREIAHRPDRDHVVNDDHALVNAADAEDCHLRLADDRQAEQRTKDSGAGDRERAALYLFRLELLVAGTMREIFNRAAQTEHVALVGVTNDRHDQSLIERDGDAQIDVALVDDVVAVERGVAE